MKNLEIVAILLIAGIFAGGLPLNSWAAPGNSGAGVFQEKEADSAKEETKAADRPTMVKAVAAPVIIVETIAARVESQVNHEIRIDMDQWTDLEVAEAAAQGTSVKQGDAVLKFDTEKIDQKMREAKLDMQLAQLEKELAAAEQDYANRVWDMEREMAETTWAETRDDIQFWLDVRKGLMIESAERSLQQSKFSVEYAQEELGQLEKMYSEDELTEESEKIVLERSKRDLDNSQFWLKRSKVETDRELAVDIPRSEEQQKRQLRKGELEYNKAMIDLPASKKRREITYEKSRVTHEKTVEEFEKLQADHSKMVLAAPAEGVLYHGSFKRGAWTNESGSKMRQIKADDNLGNDVVVMTVLDPARLQLRCDLTEAQQPKVLPGMVVHLTSEALAGKKFTGTVQSVSDFPVDGENYDCVLTLDGQPEGFRPGMGCSGKVIVYEQKSAILVPKASVFSDNDGISHYVYRWSNGIATRHEVVTGRDHDTKTEILEGLLENDEILESKPGDAK